MKKIQKNQAKRIAVGMMSAAMAMSTVCVPAMAADDMAEPTEIKIPAYTNLTVDDDGNYIEAASGTKYKKAVTILNAYVPDTSSMYKKFLSAVTNDGWLRGSADSDAHIKMYIVDCESFNKDPQRYMVDAEGNYRVDSFAWGVCTYQEPDLSGKAYWCLKDYLGNGYGFLIGHDTLYAYSGAYACYG